MPSSVPEGNGQRDPEDRAAFQAAIVSELDTPDRRPDSGKNTEPREPSLETDQPPCLMAPGRSQGWQ